MAFGSNSASFATLFYTFSNWFASAGEDIAVIGGDLGLYQSSCCIFNRTDFFHFINDLVASTDMFGGKKVFRVIINLFRLEQPPSLSPPQ